VLTMLKTFRQIVEFFLLLGAAILITISAIAWAATAPVHAEVIGEYAYEQQNINQIERVEQRVWQVEQQNEKILQRLEDIQSRLNRP
jgi:hypothetical protein